MTSVRVVLALRTLNAEIVALGQFSAHAGKSELLRWLAALPAPPKQTYLTHGEPSAAHARGENDRLELRVA